MISEIAEMVLGNGSAGGREGLMELQRAGEYWRGDERILGDGDFINQVLRAAEETLTRREELMSQPSASQAVRRGERFATSPLYFIYTLKYGETTWLLL